MKSEERTSRPTVTSPATWRGALRGAHRAREVVTILARHGLADLFAGSSLGRALRPGQTPPEGGRPTRPQRFRLALEELGPSFMKLGQYLSTRSDLLPPDWIEELERLQDECPVLPWDRIDQALDDAFGPRREHLFQSIEREPVAAGSIAQVHRVTLADGTHAVAKILRPGIRDEMLADLEALSLLAHFLDSRADELGFEPSEVATEFGEQLRKELDLVHEGRATDRFRRQFEDDDRIVFPRVHWPASTPTVLTLDELEGRQLTKLDPRELPPEERRRFVQAGVDAVFSQCLEFGFFHADPHPGNLFFLPGGRVGFIDCGMTGHIDRRTAHQLADLVACVVKGDVDRLLGVVISLAEAPPSLRDDRRFRRDVDEFVAQFADASMQDLDVGRLLDRFFHLLRRYRVTCPADLVFLIKALATIETVGERLDPEFDLVPYVRPHIEALLSERWHPQAVAERMRSSLLSYVTLLEDLPEHLRDVVSLVRSNQFRVNLAHSGLDRLTQTLEHASRNIAFALLISAVVVASAILFLADASMPESNLLSKIATGGLFVAAALAIALFFQHYRARG